MVRTGLRTLLGTEATLEVVGEAANLASGVESSVRLKPDVVLWISACPTALASKPAGRSGNARRRAGC